MADKLIYESNNSKVYYQELGEGKGPVVVKVLNQEYPSAQSIQHFYNEYEVLNGLEIAGVRKVLQMGKVQNRHSLTLAYVEGETVKGQAEKAPFSIERFLKIAIEAARILGEIHGKNIIHKDISGLNLLTHPETGEVNLIDFGISSRIDLKQAHLGNPERLEGNLSYISPEQTGRMNRIVDYRTDLYSLGVTFYEMLIGHLPFEVKDALGLVHAHIAQAPKALHEARPGLPVMVSRIINRLLAKNAEDRYQSGFGLKYDFERCLEAWKKTNSIPEFTLGERDFSGKFQISQKLFGREKELEQLLAAFDRVAQGSLETILVGGYSGTGKSALVHEIHKPITQRRGYFIEGKFDQFQRVVPYYALIQAFKEFVALMLTENEENLSHLQSVIQEAVGAEGKVLTDVLPQLELVIGPQPEVADVGGNEAQNRFNYVFRKFVNALSTVEHPIVLFIDDLQWADTASLNLLRVLMTDPDNEHLLCVCAYRDNEVSASHPFITTVAQIEDSGGIVSRIEIGNLGRQDVLALTKEALDTSFEKANPLTVLVYDKTRGNAFFVTQFLKSLYEEELLFFSFEDHVWQWDLNRIKDKNITDNVVELMAGKIQKLLRATQQALKLAACIGNKFDLDSLSVISEREASQTKEDLQAALAEGLVIPTEEGYRFSHDRIQQAVYSLIPDAEKNAVHLKIGRLLLDNISADQLDNFLFDIVNQWNWGIGIIPQQEDRDRLAELNLAAGRKAIQASAFRPAYEYLTTGIRLLRDNPWQHQYPLCLSLNDAAAEVAYYNGEFEQMNTHLDAIFAHARDLTDKIQPYAIRINAFKAENKLPEAIDTGLEVLEQLGEKFPKKPIAPLVMVDLVKTKLMLRGKDHAYLLNLPVMEDPYKKAALRILNDIASPAYWARPEVLPFLIFRMIQLSLKFGNTQVSAFGYATYGLLMCGVLGDMKEGYRFGQIGKGLLEKFGAKEWISQTYTPIYALINHWNEHIHLSLEPFLYSYRIGFETGAIEYACINVNIYCNHSYLGGLPLVRTEQEMKAYSQHMMEYKQETNFNYNEVYRQAALNMLGRSKDPTILTGEAYDQEKMTAQNLERKDRSGTFMIHFHRMMLCYFFHKYEEARVNADESRPLLDAVLAKFDVPNHSFYEGLSYLAIARQTGNHSLAKRARKNIAQFKKWAKHSPANHLHKLRLLQAEYAWLKGNDPKARSAFDEAIALAAEHKFMHEEALAYERAGLYYLETQENLAGHYLNRAHQAYLEWGAKAKQEDLARRFPQYLSVFRKSATSPLSTTTDGNTSQSHGSVLDLATVMKASTAISGEIVLGNLLRTLMKIVIENAGAQRGLLLLEEEGEWQIQAEASVAQADVQVLQGIVAEGSSLLPDSVLQFVGRTKSQVVLDDALAEDRFNSDEYIQREQAKSILCMPILNQGRMTGQLYLEHRDSQGAFTQDRIELLQLLSGQVAIAIDNARLYENLEEKVRERTAEVVEQKEKVEDTLEQLKEAQSQLVQSEKMASLGQLTAGIAHEINNPINFVTASLPSLEADFEDLKDVIGKFQLAARSENPQEHLKEAMDFAEEIDLDFLFKEINGLVKGIHDGARRTSDIVAGLRNFSRLDENAIKFADLHEGIDSTLTLLNPSLTEGIDIQKEYGELPKVECLPGKINQVLMNILNNAIQAVEMKDFPEGEGPRILIKTYQEDEMACIRIQDNGVGIEEAIQKRIFEPFFTTKDVGEGTGLGLSISYGIVEQHRGLIVVDSKAGEGATFSLKLPLHQ